MQNPPPTRCAPEHVHWTASAVQDDRVKGYQSDASPETW
jgi:hypothetical protein